MDISAGGGLGVSASTDGTCHVWDTTTGTVRVNSIAVLSFICTISLSTRTHYAVLRYRKGLLFIDLEQKK